MRVLWNRVLIAAALAVLVPNVGRAQWGSIGSYSRPQTNSRPAVSPYLNLNRGGNPAINYYGIVRPQIQTNRAFQQIEQGTFGSDPRFPVGTAVDGAAVPGSQPYYPDQALGLRTGNPATFFYYSHYYQFPGTQRGAGGGTSNANFGRPTTQGTPFYIGTGSGLIVPVNPSGANPIGSQSNTPNP